MVFTSVSDYHTRLLSGDLTCADTVDFFLQNIRRQKHLNAFTEVYETEARAAAAKLDEKRGSGESLKKLHGVVIAIKDVICYAGHRVTAASRMLHGFESLYTATALRCLLDEDAIIIGACNCDEFAMGSSNETSVYGPVLNALDETLTPGGSSGGSAVAVQADMCMLSLGSDTGGSVRQPADFCGIFGLKPGYGTISRFGLIAYASSFDQIGIFGKNIHDIALLLDIMSVPDSRDSTMNTRPAEAVFPVVCNAEKKFRFGICNAMTEHPALNPEIAEKFKELQQKLKDEGHEIIPLDFDLLAYVVPAYYVLTTAEAGSNLGRYDGIRYGHLSEKNTDDPNEFYCNNRGEGFGFEVKKRIMLGSFVLSAGFYDAYYSKAQKVRQLLISRVGEMFASVDALIMPVSPTTAFRLGQHNKNPLEMYLADIFTVFANLTASPAVAVPLFTHSNGMPFGVQVLCPRGKEKIMLEIAAALTDRLPSYTPLIE